MERLEQLGWEAAANVANTLHELEEKVTKSEKNYKSNVCAGLSQKNKTELRDVYRAPSIPLSGTRDETTAGKEDQRGTSRARPLRQATLDYGRH